MDPTGKYLENMHYINEVFYKLKERYENISVFDVQNSPDYLPNIRGNGLFIDDAVHFTPEVNMWVAKRIIYCRL